jgi:3-phenylpropionate/trans-cinnamate dioxygenase ferredoxin reductase subunit
MFNHEPGTVIVGAGMAAAILAKTLRDLGDEHSITIIGDEPFAPYDRPPLSKEVLASKLEPEPDYKLDLQAASQIDIELILNTRVVSVDRVTRTVVLSNGQALQFRNLIFATGGRARKLPQKLDPEQLAHSLRSFDDALSFRRLLSTSDSIAVIGGGWLGMEVAAAARLQGLNVTVIEVGDRLCGRAAPIEISKELYDLHTKNGTHLLLNTAVERIEKAGNDALLRLNDGSTIQVNSVFAMIGLAPCDTLASECGLPTQDGILVDANLRTADEGIYAIGDCARVAHSGPKKETSRLESWDNARIQALAVANQLMGNPVQPVPPCWFWSDQFGHNFQVVGRTDQELTVHKRQTSKKPGMSYLYMSGQILCGVAAINAGRDISAARRLLHKPTEIDLAKAMDASSGLQKSALSSTE